MTPSEQLFLHTVLLNTVRGNIGWSLPSRPRNQFRAYRVSGLGFSASGFWASQLQDEGLGSGVLGFGVWGLGIRALGLGFGAQQAGRTLEIRV